MKNTILLGVFIYLLNLNSAHAQSAIIFQDNMNGLNDTTALKARGYCIYDRSIGGPGTTGIWFQGNPIVFPSYNGPDSGYMAANYNCIIGQGDIDNWLVLPALNLSAGDTISFFTQSNLNSIYPDSLRVMYSAAGDSTPEDISWIELGRFQSNVLGIWERNAFGIPSSAINARLAIRYAVVDGGPIGANSDYVGIDQIEVVSSDANVITGKIFVDQNLNGVYDAGEILAANQKVYESNSNTTAFANNTGDYFVAVIGSGNFVVNPVLPFYYNSVPANHGATFTGINQIDSLNDFALQPTTVANDLCITVTPMGSFRAGFNAIYSINYENVGTTSISGDVIFFPDSNVTFQSASVTPSSVSPDSVVWTTGILNPFQTGSITVYVTVNVGTPIGTSINSLVRIEPVAGDANPYCNYSNWAITTIGSFDPNDILVSDETLFTNQISNPPFLDYIINFQNTGNDTAFNIHVQNTIPLNLNMNTFEFVASSHPMVMNYNATSRLMDFGFYNVLLVDSNANEPLSHGFIRYRIKPNTTLVLGDSIANMADIYFDFNAPVATNYAVTKVILPTGINDFISENSQLNIFPNPANDKLTLVVYDKNLSGGKIIISDVIGNVVMEKIKSDNATETLDIRKLSKGFYTISIENAEQKLVRKFVKD